MNVLVVVTLIASVTMAMTAVWRTTVTRDNVFRRDDNDLIQQIMALKVQLIKEQARSKDYESAMVHWKEAYDMLQEEQDVHLPEMR